MLQDPQVFRLVDRPEKYLHRLLVADRWRPQGINLAKCHLPEALQPVRRPHRVAGIIPGDWLWSPGGRYICWFYGCVELRLRLLPFESTTLLRGPLPEFE